MITAKKIAVVGLALVSGFAAFSLLAYKHVSCNPELVTHAVKCQGCHLN